MTLYVLQIFVKIWWDYQRLIQMLPIQAFIPVNGQLSSSYQHIPDLTTIQLPFRQVIKMISGLVKVDVLLIFLKYVQKILPSFPNYSTVLRYFLTTFSEMAISIFSLPLTMIFFPFLPVNSLSGVVNSPDLRSCLLRDRTLNWRQDRIYTLVYL